MFINHKKKSILTLKTIQMSFLNYDKFLFFNKTSRITVYAQINHKFFKAVESIITNLSFLNYLNSKINNFILIDWVKETSL